MDSFMCSGTLDPHLVQRASLRLWPIFQAIDILETDRLGDALSQLATERTKPSTAQMVRSMWPEFSAPTSRESDLSLPLTKLSPREFLPIIRRLEDLSEGGAVLTYWARSSAARLLPGGSRYRELIRDSLCVSIFSEERCDPPDEWAFVSRSQNLSVFIYGQQELEGGNLHPRLGLDQEPQSAT